MRPYLHHSETNRLFPSAVAVRVRRPGLHTGYRLRAPCPPGGTLCWRCPSPTNRLEEENFLETTGRIEPATSPTLFNDAQRVDASVQVHTALHRMNHSSHANTHLMHSSGRFVCASRCSAILETHFFPFTCTLSASSVKLKHETEWRKLLQNEGNNQFNVA